MIGPLAGKFILVTRPKHQAAALSGMLRNLGADVCEMPVIEIGPPPDRETFDDALRHLGEFDWLVLTSANGVDSLAARVAELKLDRSLVTDRKLAAIGPATASRLAEVFRGADAVPESFVSEAIAEVVGDPRGRRFLLARADLARRELADLLRAKGALVQEVAAYSIRRAQADLQLPEQTPDAIVLTSAEVARATRDVLAAKARGHWMQNALLACIGPITAAAVIELGLKPGVVAQNYTAEGVVQAVAEFFAKEAAHA